jgi:precorrin-3B synthase
MLTLADVRADVRLVAIRNGREPAVAVGLDTQVGVDWLGSVPPTAAAAVAMEIAHAFLEVTSDGRRRRMRDLSAEGLASLRSAIGDRFSAVTRDPRQTSGSPERRVGLLDLGSGRFAVGIAAPFGRVETDPLLKLAGEMAALGVEEVRLSPWRTLYMEVSSASAGQAILDAAKASGFITDPGDPLLQIEACPGAPACWSTSLDIRSDARRLAALLPRFGFAGTVHVSGCAKGCAKSGASDLVLVGAEGRYGIVRKGAAQDRPARSASFSELAADPRTLFDRVEGGGHG